ncbi:unnamed protein product [Schistosoma curassoni]|uniref:Ovule protein n=1 Tax=Schistosoma curassoni TaxID=6186 RepID=A0A183K0V5_9TREM|nr:unnamed protein product [Schistosoma curassoni]
MSFILTYELLLYDLPFFNYALSINHCLPHSQPHLTKSCKNVVSYFMVLCGLFGWYINEVCLKYMIHIAEVEIGVLDLTVWARR